MSSASRSRLRRDLASTLVVLQPDQSAALVDVTPTVFEELNRRFEGFKGRVLVSAFSFDSDRTKGTWHTARTQVPTRMLFVTPGEGTENRPV